MKTTHDDIDQAKPTVLFLCSRNSARSQIAEGILRSIAGDSLNVLSAGLEPSEIHPMTREVMAEIGIPLDSHRSKGTHEYLGRVSIRHAVIVCEKLESQCPTIYPFAIQTHYWPFEDPAPI